MDQNEHRKEDEFAGRITMLQIQVERGKQKQCSDKEKNPHGCSQGLQVKAIHTLLLVVNILYRGEIHVSAFAFCFWLI